MKIVNGYKAVCYQCNHEARSAVVDVGQGHDRCPVCSFPLIFEPDRPPTGARRSPVLRRTAPLPGIHPRRLARGTGVSAPLEAPKMTTPRAITERGSGTSVHHRLGIAAKLGLVLMGCSAVAAGALAAAALGV